MRRLDGITNSMDVSLSQLQEIEKTRKAVVLQSMGSQIVRHDLATEKHQSLFPHPLTLLLSDNHLFVLCTYESVSVFLCLFMCFGFFLDSTYK